MSAFLLAMLIVVTALVAALVGVVLVQAVEARRAGAPTRAEPTPPALEAGPAFLFDEGDLLDATPAGHRLLAGTGTGSMGGGAQSGLDRVVAVLAPRFEGLAEGLARLRDTGSLSLSSSGPGATGSLLKADFSGGLMRIELLDELRENRALRIDPISWRLAEEELSDLRAVTNGTPTLIWRENAAGSVTWANSAYVALALADQDDTLKWPFPQLFPGARNWEPRVEQRAQLQVGGVDHWFEVSTQDSRDGDRLCFAHPIDKLVSAETSLRDFMQTLTKTFAQLPIGLAVFDRERRLQLFNPALLDLTGLPADVLAARPKMVAVLDLMRQRNRLPEPKNYRSWRGHLIDLERGAQSGQYLENWLLPDGLVYRVTARQHPGGGLSMMIEDISDHIQRSVTVRNEIELGRTALDHVDHPIAIFSASGRLQLSNAAFSRLWDLDQPQDLRGMALEELAPLMSAHCAPTSFWRELAHFLATIGNREAWERSLRCTNGTALTCMVRPIQSSHTLVSFQELPAQIRRSPSLAAKARIAG